MGGVTRLLFVPMAFEMESNGRRALETGKDGVRRGGTVAFDSDELLDIGDVKEFPEKREIAVEDFARRVGMLENTGSVSSVSSLISGPDALPSEVCDPSSDEEDPTDAPELMERALLESAGDDVGDIVKLPDAQDEDERGPNMKDVDLSVLRGASDEVMLP